MTVGSQVRTCLASIKSIEAELELLVNHTQDNETKRIFEDTNKLIKEIKEDLSMQMIKISNEEPQYK